MKAIPNIELSMAFNYLSSITGTGLSVDELKKLRSARKTVKENMEEYNEVRKSIWDSYGISDEVQLDTHEKKEEVTEKVKALDKEEVQIAGLNFLSEYKVIVACPPSWNQHDIDKAIEYLSAEN